MTRLLYLGDTDLSSAAAYLAGIISRAGWTMDYLPSHLPLTESLLAADHTLYIVSDYPAQNCGLAVQQQLVDRVQRGMAGLLMLGGWESYHGFGGNWDGTPIGDLLPVEIRSEDDRQNFDQPCFLHPATRESMAHPILTGLPWLERPPVIGGLNRWKPKASATTLLVASSFATALPDQQFDRQAEWTLRPVARYPALCVDEPGRDGGRGGRVAAFASDVAPHWVGGLVDWGSGRVTAQASGAGAVEVGSAYVQFFEQLLRWTASDTLS